MGNMSWNCQSRDGVLILAPCSVLISRGRGVGRRADASLKERADGLG